MARGTAKSSRLPWQRAHLSRLLGRAGRRRRTVRMQDVRVAQDRDIISEVTSDDVCDRRFENS